MGPKRAGEQDMFEIIDVIMGIGFLYLLYLFVKFIFNS